MAKKIEEKETKYIVLTNFTERGKSRGYVVGETFPRPDDQVGEDTYKRLLGGNPNGIYYIEEV